MRTTNRRGFALIEVLVSALLLATACTGLLGLIAQHADALYRAWRVEQLLAPATEAVTRISLWPRDRLEQSTGSLLVAGVTVRIAGVGPSLFDVITLDPDGAPQLRTTLYRPANAR